MEALLRMGRRRPGLGLARRAFDSSSTYHAGARQRSPDFFWSQPQRPTGGCSCDGPAIASGGWSIVGLGSLPVQCRNPTSYDARISNRGYRG